jgi:hypothetical protein
MRKNDMLQNTLSKGVDIQSFCSKLHTFCSIQKWLLHIYTVWITDLSGYPDTELIWTLSYALLWSTLNCHWTGIKAVLQNITSCYPRIVLSVPSCLSITIARRIRTKLLFCSVNRQWIRIIFDKELFYNLYRTDLNARLFICLKSISTEFLVIRISFITFIYYTGNSVFSEHAKFDIYRLMFFPAGFS